MTTCAKCKNAFTDDKRLGPWLCIVCKPEVEKDDLRKEYEGMKILDKLEEEAQGIFKEKHGGHT